MPFKWDAGAELKILLVLINNLDVKPPSSTFQLVAEVLGDGVSASACSQRFHKLRRDAEALLADTNGNAPATPSAHNKGTPTKNTPKGRSRKRKVQLDAEAETQNEVQEEGIASESPDKKIKKDAEEV